MTEYYLGIMSGTSLDGIDAAICSFDADHQNVDLIGAASMPWPNELRQRLMAVASAENVNLDEVTRLHFTLPYYYQEAASKAIGAATLAPDAITAIGLHGQTIRHLTQPVAIGHGAPAVRATLQLGSGPALAALTGIDVISDFRAADVALGGQGAPLVPMFDDAFLRSDHLNRVVLNLGGIANLTWLPSTESQRSMTSRQVIAFDSGPANMIIDALTREHFNRPYDDDGTIARHAQPDAALLDELLAHPYFALPPPKSTGRELFGPEFLRRFNDRITNDHRTPEDMIATATELTAATIAHAIRALPAQPAELLVSGGGAKNGFLIERIAELLKPVGVKSTNTFGIPVQLKEAIAFAFFAQAFVHRQKIHLPQTTGATRQRILGSLSPGS